MRDKSTNTLKRKNFAQIVSFLCLSANNYFLLMRMSLTVLAATEEDPTKTWWETVITRKHRHTKPHTTHRERERERERESNPSMSINTFATNTWATLGYKNTKKSNNIPKEKINLPTKRYI